MLGIIIISLVIVLILYPFFEKDKYRITQTGYKYYIEYKGWYHWIRFNGEHTNNGVKIYIKSYYNNAEEADKIIKKIIETDKLKRKVIKEYK